MREAGLKRDGEPNRTLTQLTHAEALSAPVYVYGQCWRDGHRQSGRLRFKWFND